MTTCETCQRDLDAYLDSTLPAARQQEIALHLERCSACRLQFDRARRIESGIAAVSTGWQPTEELWARIEHSARHGDAAARSARRPYAWMVAAMLIMTIGITSFTVFKPDSPGATEIVASALINEFHTFVVSHRELDFSDTQPGEVRNWFADKVEFRVPLPLKSADLKLAGGRLCYMLNQRVASFMYQIDGAWVSLYIMRSARASQNLGASHELILEGYAFIDWDNQGLHYSLVGDLPVARLREIAEHLRNTRILTRLPDLRTADFLMVSQALPSDPTARESTASRS